jgi:hypothetical protein
MDSEGLLLFSKELITRPYPKPQTLISLQPNLLLPSHLLLRLPSNLFLSEILHEYVTSLIGDIFSVHSAFLDFFHPHKLDWNC